jgi:methionyl-tRNA synthetase
MSDMENPTPVDTNPTDPAAASANAPTRTRRRGPPRWIPCLCFPSAAAPRSPPGPATSPRIRRRTPAGSSRSSLRRRSQQRAEGGDAAQITIDDFVKVELRVAQILVAERIPKADKLLRLEVDLGEFGKRQILSGIAEWYAPEDLVGRRIIVITNLAPRKMRGLESHGMLLAASEEGGKPFLATVPEGVASGTRLK